MFQFYVAGAAFKVYGDKNIIKGGVGALMAFLFVIMVWVNYTFLPQDSLLAYVMKMMMAYMGCFASFILFIAYANSNSPLVLLGQSTMGIYAIHQYLIVWFGMSNVWLSFMIVLALSVVFVFIIRRTKFLKFVIGE